VRTNGHDVTTSIPDTVAIATWMPLYRKGFIHDIGSKEAQQTLKLECHTATEDLMLLHRKNATCDIRSKEELQSLKLECQPSQNLLRDKKKSRKYQAFT